MPVFIDGVEMQDVADIVVNITKTQATPECPVGYHWDGTQCVADDPAPDPDPTGALLADEAATMAEGEWRPLADKTTWPGKATGTTFKGFQYVGIADGMGWTQPLVHHNGELAMLLCRDTGEQALMRMSAAGDFTRIEEPVGFGADGTRNGGRRPFNRLMQDAQYMMFAPRGAKIEMGHLIRSPLDNLGAFEKVGPDIGDDQMDSTGNFSMIWVEEWGRFYAYTPGGKIYSRAPADTSWLQHPAMPADTNGHKLSGYAGMLVWNPIKQEILIQGGQYFGDSPDTSDKVYRITQPLGAIEMLANRKFPDGTPMYWDHAQSKCLVHPIDGSYLVIPKGQYHTFYRMVSGGGTAHLFDDFSAIHDSVVGGYEMYVVFALIPNTDVFAFISHIRGLGLYRPKSVAGLPTERETDPILLPDGGGNEPPAGSNISVLAEATEPGTITALGGTHDGYATYKEYWKAGGHSADQDTYGPTGFWDSIRQKLVYVRDRTPTWTNDLPPLSNVQVKLYDAASQAWTMGDMSSADNVAIGAPHSYCRQALDQSRGHAYYGPNGSRIVRFLIDQNTWDIFNVSAPVDLDGIAPCCYHEALDMLIRPQSQASNPVLCGWKNGDAAWTVLGSLNGHQGYQALMRYNRVRQDMLIVGGYPQNPRRVTLIDSVGNIIPKADIPLGANGNPIFTTSIGGSYAALFYDPMSGNYLYKSDNKFWEYSPELDEWRLAIDFDLDANKHMIPGPYFGWVMAPIDELGVIAWMNYYGTRLYRHLSVF